ncbi:MAG: helix-turn-helix transcriptional regulator [Candidatus Limnocylindria bacterium]
MTPLLLRPAEAAELLGVSRSQIYSLVQAGELPGVVRLGGSIRLHWPTVERWLAEEANGTNRGASRRKLTPLEVDRDADPAPTPAA